MAEHVLDTVVGVTSCCGNPVVVTTWGAVFHLIHVDKSPKWVELPRVPLSFTTERN